jgi:DNA-binding response OmpR family regulator
MDKGKENSKQHGVLIVDDDCTISAALAEHLSLQDLKTYQAATGFAAINLMERVDVSVAIIDVMMPEMDGIETIRKIRESFPSVKILAISGGPDLYLDNARYLGADIALKKPFRFQTLTSIIESLIKENTILDLK